MKNNKKSEDYVQGHLDDLLGGGLAVVGWSTLRLARGRREGGEGKPSEQGGQERSGSLVFYTLP